MENKARPWFFLTKLLHLFFSLKNSLSTDVLSISMDQTLAGDQTISSKGDIFELGFFKPELLDTGNFVLRDGSDSSAVIWQSFDDPTDTWLPKGWFGRNMITGEIKPLISWKNHEDPALGMFSLQIDSNGNDRGSLLWNRSEVYWRGGIQNNFNRIIELNSGRFLNFSYFNKEGQDYLTYNPVNSSFIARALLDTSGRLQLCGWLESSRQWKCFWVQPTTQCEVYSLCGKFGVCTKNSQPFCSCLRGFETKSMEDWNLSDRSAGGVRKTNLKCGYNSSSVGEKDGFLVIHNMRLPGNVQSLTVGSAKDCELSCLSHCSYFGMAKLVGWEFSRVLTTMRGTIGYLAPEWISGVPITPKADVYSYGMMLFEIISGKRNAEQLRDGESAFFPCWAAEKIAEDEVLALLDFRLDDITNIEELRRVSRVACWCIQDNENDRPSMELVVDEPGFGN
ncbi:hypothetical protein AAC387_Pa06g3091 [Persea americana]